jgi:hypothetical protein
MFKLFPGSWGMPKNHKLTELNLMLVVVTRYTNLCIRVDSEQRQATHIPPNIEQYLQEKARLIRC